MSIANDIAEFFKSLFASAESEIEKEAAKLKQDAIDFGVPAMEYVEQNGGAPLRQAADEEVLAMEALVTDGPSKAAAAQAAIIAKLVAAEIKVVIGAVNAAIEMAHAKMVMAQQAAQAAATAAEAATGPETAA